MNKSDYIPQTEDDLKYLLGKQDPEAVKALFREDTPKAIPAYKVGRCFNGFHRDGGTIIHLVPPHPPGMHGDWFTKALCGTQPGYRGNGWSPAGKDATCPKCLKKQPKEEPKPAGPQSDFHIEQLDGDFNVTSYHC